MLLRELGLLGGGNWSGGTSLGNTLWVHPFWGARRTVLARICLSAGEIVEIIRVRCSDRPARSGGLRRLPI